MESADFPEDLVGETREEVEAGQEQPRRNAFTMLMSASKKSATSPAASSDQRRNPVLFSARNGLGLYLASPKHPLVVYENDFGVAIKDLYPKSYLHMLFIPRDSDKMFLHPFEAFEDPVFLERARYHVAQLKQVVALELRNKLGKFSEAEKPRRIAMDSANTSLVSEQPELPPGRDWDSELLVGIHAGPSMNHLHIHVLSPDHVNDCMRHRKHYNSFATPFLVRLEEFPLPQDDRRRQRDCGGWLSNELVCWRCKKNFRNRFSALKFHLKEEFEEWKKL